VNLDQLRVTYQIRKLEVEKIWQRNKELKSDEEMFALLVSCIISSRAKWKSVKAAMNRLKNNRVLFVGNHDNIKQQLKGISGRYINIDRLADYILQARESFPFLSWIIRGILNNQISLTPQGLNFRDVCRLQDLGQLCELLQERRLSTEGLREMVKQIKGINDKQASHFLATLGFEDYAILDTHVLKQLVENGVITEKPKYLSHRKYTAIEELMKEFSKSIGIPFPHLDTIFWEEGSRGKNC